MGTRRVTESRNDHDRSIRGHYDSLRSNKLIIRTTMYRARRGDVHSDNSREYLVVRGLTEWMERGEGNRPELGF